MNNTFLSQNALLHFFYGSSNTCVDNTNTFQIHDASHTSADNTGAQTHSKPMSPWSRPDFCWQHRCTNTFHIHHPCQSVADNSGIVKPFSQSMPVYTYCPIALEILSMNLTSHLYSSASSLFFSVHMLHLWPILQCFLVVASAPFFSSLSTKILKPVLQHVP